MKVLNSNYITETLQIFKTAPDSFYSPCGRNQDLSINEIEVRTFLAPSQLRISLSEIVFRKLWEITREVETSWDMHIAEALSFFKILNYDNDTVCFAIELLKNELNFLNNNQGRVIHNPF